MPVKKLPNGKDIDISVLDTPTSLEKKIALAYGVDLRFLNKFTVNQHTDFSNLNIVPLQELMDAYIEKYIDNKEDAFSKFYRQTESRYKQVTPTEFVELWRLATSRHLIQPIMNSAASVGGFTESDFSYTDPIDITYPKNQALPRNRGNRVLVRELSERRSDGTPYILVLYKHDLVDNVTIIDRIARAYNVHARFLNWRVLERVPHLDVDKLIGDAQHICPMLRNYAKHNNFGDFVYYARQSYYLSNNEYVRLWLTFADGKTGIYLTNLENDIQVLKGEQGEEEEDNSNKFKYVNINLGRPPQITMTDSLTDYQADIGKFNKAVLDFGQIKTDDVAMTDFEQTKQFLSININNPNKYPMEYIFDQLKLTPDIPFAAYDTYCKVYRNFILNGDVNVTPASIVLLYRRNIAYDDDAPAQTAHSQQALWMSYYNTVRIRFPEHKDKDKEKEDTTVLLEMDVHIKANLDTIRRHLQDVLQNVFADNAMQQGTTKKESGELYILGQNVDIFVLKDILLFHSIFKKSVLH